MVSEIKQSTKETRLQAVLSVTRFRFYSSLISRTIVHKSIAQIRNT